eukprot:193861-Karenia_brevis.AAC.1
MVRGRGQRFVPLKVREELLCAVCLLPIMRRDSRVPVSGMVTASDASSTGGAVSRSVRLTNKGLSSLALSSLPYSLTGQDT